MANHLALLLADHDAIRFPAGEQQENRDLEGGGDRAQHHDRRVGDPSLNAAEKAAGNPDAGRQTRKGETTFGPELVDPAAQHGIALCGLGLRQHRAARISNSGGLRARLVPHRRHLFDRRTFCRRNRRHRTLVS